MDMTDQDLPKQEPIRNAPRAADLVAKALSQPSTESNTTSQPTKLPDRLLERFWLKMTEMYGHRWTSSYGDRVDHDSVWGKVLAGLNGNQLAAGLHELVERGAEFDWPPPANVFRSLCMQMPGFPSEAQAWTEALVGKYSHEAVKVAAEATGTYDLRSAKHSDKALRQNFERHYAIVMRRALNAQPLDGKIPAGIGHDTKTPRQVQLAASHQEARDLMAAQNIPTDPKAARALLLAKMGIRRDKHA